MDWCHQSSAARGHVVQVMIGIPNFYRQFGYEYAISMHPWASLTPDTPSPEGFNVRSAALTDVPDLQRLQSTLQDSFDVAAPHQADCWSWLIRGTSSEIWVAERSISAGSRVEGVARVVGERDSELAVGEIAAESSDATRALLANARQLAGTSHQVRVSDRPQVPDLSNLLSDPERIDWYYIRVPDPSALLEALGPELLTQANSHGLRPWRGAAVVLPLVRATDLGRHRPQCGQRSCSPPGAGVSGRVGDSAAVACRPSPWLRRRGPRSEVP